MKQSRCGRKNTDDSRVPSADDEPGTSGAPTGPALVNELCPLGSDIHAHPITFQRLALCTLQAVTLLFIVIKCGKVDR